MKPLIYLMEQSAIFLNWTAVIGWSFLMFQIIYRNIIFQEHDQSLWETYGTFTIGLEMICVWEVFRMIIGNLSGNVALGCSLHYTRMFLSLVIFRIDVVSKGQIPSVVLMAWSVTEVIRYLYYIVGNSKSKIARQLIPILTFPLGAGGEAWACYTALPYLRGLTYYLAILQIGINTIGGTAIYPGMVKRGMRALKGDKRKKRKKGQEIGVVFPPDERGGRSTTAAGKKIIAAALRGCQEGGHDAAVKVEKEKGWRFGYNKHIKTLVELSLSSPEAAINIAEAGLSYMHSNFEFISSDDEKAMTLEDAMCETLSGSFEFHSGCVKGTCEKKDIQLSVPYNGGYTFENRKAPGPEDILVGHSLKAQLTKWAELGVIEIDAAKSITFVSDYFAEGHNLSNYYFILIGAGSAMGPFSKLLELGANVIALDIPGKWNQKTVDLWERLIKTAENSPGTLFFPLSKAQKKCQDKIDLYKSAGADLMKQPMMIRTWLLSLLRDIPKNARLVIGNYTYLDGALHVKLSLAADAIIKSLRTEYPSMGVAFLCTPTDIHVIPQEAHIAAEKNYGYHGIGWIIEKIIQGVTFGKKLVKNALPPIRSINEKKIYLVDGLSVAQGPNYAIAKRVQHWRAQVAFAKGAIASSRVAPSTATLSVVHNKTFQLAYFGMRYFKPLEIFHQETTNAVMTALLISDVINPESSKNPSNSNKFDINNTLELFRTESVHGGIWRAAYKVDSIGETSVLVYLLGGPQVFPYIMAILLFLLTWVMSKFGTHFYMSG